MNFPEDLETGKLYRVRRRFFDIKSTGMINVKAGSIVMAVSHNTVIHQGKVVWVARTYREQEYLFLEKIVLP